MADSRDDAIRMIREARLYPPDPERARRTNAGGIESFRELLSFSQRSPDEFWGAVASELEWFRPWDTLHKGGFPCFEYFSGGISNPCHNLLDRHVSAGAGNRVALIWEGENGDRKFLTFRMLLAEVGRFANVLKHFGVGRGDTVAIFLPNLVETAIAVLACFRIGAIFNTVFSGFSAAALRDRLINFEPKVLITADGAFRRGKIVDLKIKADDAIRDIASVQTVVVVKRTDREVTMVLGRDFWWDEVMRSSSMECPPEPMEANEPGLVFYTSGTTGKPKGVVHAGMAFVVNNYAYCKYQMDHHPDDVLWCTADIGWLTMHIWGIAGALANGLTTLFFEGALDYPAPDRFYRIVDRYRVNKIFTTPSAIRMLMKFGEEWLRPHDISSLEVVSLVGEPFDPEAWHWLHDTLGRGNICVNNTYGQTELGGCPISGAAWLTPMKPGSCGVEFLGASVDVVDEDGNASLPNVPGRLVVKRPYPMMVRTLWKEPERFAKEYFSTIPGCYYTFDAAIRDDDGHFWVIGRLDDVINVAGHRLSTMEIESAIMSCQAVAEAAVIGVPDEIKGLVPAAFVTLRANVASSPEIEREIRRAVVDHIGKIALPGRIVFAGALPKTPSGKIMRRLLREIMTKGAIEGDITGLEDVSTVDIIRRALAVG